jgi:hypothetical protein
VAVRSIDLIADLVANIHEEASFATPPAQTQPSWRTRVSWD